MTNELILKVMDLASIMPYKEAGEHLCDEFVLSKYTTRKTIHDVLLDTYFEAEIDRGVKKTYV